MILKNELREQLKDKYIAYLYLLLLNSHYIYLGRWGIQLIYWFTFGISIAFSSVTFPFYIVPLVWFLVDFFTLHKKIKKHNDIIYTKLAHLEIEEFERVVPSDT